jgi:hypothetical protein
MDPIVKRTRTRETFFWGEHTLTRYCTCNNMN